jgi:predicted polyphosphate/ATP-dependent NAD kinase
MGGRVGLKGTDGIGTIEKAIDLGATMHSPERTEEFLRQLSHFESEFELITYSGIMGEKEALNCGFKPRVLGRVGQKTSRADTIEAARLMKNTVDIIVFCGGDGTARDIVEVIDAKTPLLGIPAGVKMHSAVFALNPQSAARVIREFLFDRAYLSDAEVVDIDEEAYRRGDLSPRIYGYALTPRILDLVQNMKTPSAETEDEREAQKALARSVIDKMSDGVYYILGPGTTVKAVAEILGAEKTILGVDILLNKKIIAKDVNENEILTIVDGKDARIVVSPIGNQFFLFGRGNQQISPSVIRRIGKTNIIVISTKDKLRKTTVLRVDTGDNELDEQLRGYVRVVTGYNEETLMKI